jgi:hypothetical protein
MSYEKTRDCLVNKLIEGKNYQKKVDEKVKKFALTEKAMLCYSVRYICEKLYDDEIYDTELKDYIASNNIEEKENNWLYIKRDFGEGRFINSNEIFENAFCKTNSCHSCAYRFVYFYKGDDAQLVSGVLDHINEGSGILHSIALFNLNGKEMVFDGANFMIMDKDLYYSLFNFKEISKINKTDLVSDMLKFSFSDNCEDKNKILKINQFSRRNGITSIPKKFSGLGFLIYLYNREAVVNDKCPDLIREQENLSAMNRVKIALGENDDNYSEDEKFG